jgi:uncharacterized protein YwgA
MKDYWLAKLISSVREVDSRKRLQKSIYLLQQTGCPLHCSYILHYYGPYSFELAGLIDQISDAGVIKETHEGSAYKSSITPAGNNAIKNFEKTEAGAEAKEALNSFIPKFAELNKQNPWQLELAATIAYFYRGDWAEAQKQTVIFKKLSISDSNLKQAFELAKNFRKSA